MNLNATAELIVHHLQAASVLCFGSETALLTETLRKRGIERVIQTTTALPDGRWDLIVWTGGVCGGVEIRVSDAVERLSKATDAILFCCPEVPVQALRSLVQCGFVPDCDHSGGSEAVLLCRRRLPSADTGSAVEEMLETYGSEIRMLQIALERQNVAIEKLSRQVSELSAGLETLSRSTADVTQSRIWKSLCRVGGWLLAIAALVERHPSASGTGPAPGQEHAEYERWIAEFEQRDPARIRRDLEQLSSRPLVSILTPRYCTNLPELQRSIETVLAQSYSDWELCIPIAGASDASAGEDYLLQVASKESRIRLIQVERSSDICDGLNSALEAASGAHAALLHSSDVLAHDALLRLVELLNGDPAADILTSA